MAEQLRILRRRIESIRELQVVVNTMRAQAAGPARQAQAVLPAMRTYASVVGAALSEALLLLPERPATAGAAPRGVVVFCAEHGFAGAFSRHLLEAVEAEAGRDVSLFVLGSKGVTIAREKRLPIVWSAPMASHFDSVTSVADGVADSLYRRFLSGTVRSVEIVFARIAGGGLSQIERQSLLPVARPPPARSRGWARPITYLPTEVLLENIVGEYFFAELAHAAMESFSAENAARLATMEAARHHIDEKLDELIGQERTGRQEQITSELLEVVTGSEALGDL